MASARQVLAVIEALSKELGYWPSYEQIQDRLQSAYGVTAAHGTIVNRMNELVRDGYVIRHSKGRYTLAKK